MEARELSSHCTMSNIIRSQAEHVRKNRQSHPIYIVKRTSISVNGALTKTLTNDQSVLEIVFFRNIVGMIFLLMVFKHTPTKLPGGEPLPLVLHGLLGFSAMILFFYNIVTIPLGMTITLNETSPLFCLYLSIFSA